MYSSTWKCLIFGHRFTRQINVKLRIAGCSREGCEEVGWSRRSDRYFLGLALVLVSSTAFAQVGQPVNVKDAITGYKAIVDSNGNLHVKPSSGGGGGGTVDQGVPNTSANAWPIIPYPAPVGSQGNAWNAASVSANGTSTAIDCRYAPFVDVFGVMSSAGTIQFQVSQDGTNYYTIDSATRANAGDFGIHVILGSRYARLKSSAAMVITATIAGKT